jgi:hypothetical protein
MKKIIIFVVMLMTASTASADSFTGYVKRLAPNSSATFNGILIMIESASSSEVITLSSGNACTSQWGFFEVETGVGKSMYSTLLTAYSLSRPVTIYTNGCASAANFPKVEEIYLDKQ